MNRSLLLLICLLMTSTSHGKGFFDDCRDPVTGMIGKKCVEGYQRKNPEIGFDTGMDEIVSIRRSGDDKLIIKFGDGHLEDYHRRPNGTWGKGLYADPTSGTTIAK